MNFMGRMKFFKFGLARFQSRFQKLGFFCAPKAIFTPLVMAGFFLSFLLLLAFNLYYSYYLSVKRNEAEINRKQIEQIRRQIASWENIIKEFPGYRDAYLQLAILNFKISNHNEAKKYLLEALKIDPNNPTAKQLSTLLTTTTESLAEGKK